ncbi:MAG TPA: PriCT-2 domain-containing protein [Amaricoccus sp.]|uniref:PriCT-2 domain-containing protein n=1 Tax=Amaricoccus sp. TaxID=1872485 RepID=UPI002CA1B419|nr:PriCT-2 domain-containing protein [Amaricoccus sp.]HMQ92668.1 PriCT-2 domain-containing protein [Amaricoccus sp.]HMR53819.1 PriCT-2 domain-containing protein [Amaricoccus sp.]HMR60762.1 PriCT-2 domain-containing protein [Amaricoccus sp.]HMU00814.1 PriCT-2 domain-containing protein [Amaricoccus sp.]
MTDQSFMERFGPRLVTNGYPILPIMPGTKKPGRFRGGAWSDYPDWTRHAERPTTEHELGIWQTWPDAGVGILCGPVVGIDIDIVDADLALALERLARARLGDTPALRIGRAPKRLLVYRTLQPFAGIRRAPLEVLGLGQQFVAHAIHPDIGRPYEWPEESLADLDIEGLPTVDEAMARAFVDEALTLVPDHLKPARLSAAPSVGAGPSHSQAGTLIAIREALAWIPNADLDYDSWVRIGLALKGALGGAGRDLFASWSAQSGKDDAAFTAKTWDGLKAERIGAGTIYHVAMERGWKPDSALVLDGAAPVDAVHPAAALLASVQASAPSTPPAQPPFELRVPEGILAGMVDYMVSTARRPQPLLSLGASLCALGALMGRKYRTETNLRSNLYVVGVADSGSGKNHAREIVNELFFEAGLAQHLGGNKIASGAGLLTALHRQPALLLQIDEFGMFLSAAADRKRSPRHITEILDNMTELYTAAGSVFLGAEYANHDGRNDRRDIVQPCLCVYGTTTPLHFWNALQSANVVDGSLARFIILPTEDDYPEEALGRGIRTAPAGLVERLRLVAAGGGHVPSGNLAGLGAGTTTAVEPMTVPMTQEASDAFSDLGSEITRELRQARGTGHTAVLARVSENAQKLALVAAVSRDPVAPAITLGDAEWAIGFVRSFARNTMRAVERHVADNEIERNHKRVLDIIRRAGPGGLTKTELTRKTQFLDRRTRDEQLVTLAEAGLLTTRLRPSATKHTVVLVALDGDAA